MIRTVGVGVGARRGREGGGVPVLRWSASRRVVGVGGGGEGVVGGTGAYRRHVAERGGPAALRCVLCLHYIQESSRSSSNSWSRLSWIWPGATRWCGRKKVGLVRGRNPGAVAEDASNDSLSLYFSQAGGGS